MDHYIGVVVLTPHELPSLLFCFKGGLVISEGDDATEGHVVQLRTLEKGVLAVGTILALLEAVRVHPVVALIESLTVQFVVLSPLTKIFFDFCLTDLVHHGIGERSDVVII